MNIDTIVRDANRSEIARNTDLSLSGVSRILSGHRNATSKNLHDIAAELGVDMDVLYGYLQMVKNRRKAARRNNRSASVA